MRDHPLEIHNSLPGHIVVMEMMVDFFASGLVGVATTPSVGREVFKADSHLTRSTGYIHFHHQ
jgi:hypothetical protein